MSKKKIYDEHLLDAPEVPKSVYESFARCLLPLIKTYYDSDEGKKAFKEWKEKKDAK